MKQVCDTCMQLFTGIACQNCESEGRVLGDDPAMYNPGTFDDGDGVDRPSRSGETPLLGAISEDEKWDKMREIVGSPHTTMNAIQAMLALQQYDRWIRSRIEGNKGGK
jgi:hypothetical protein